MAKKKVTYESLLAEVREFRLAKEQADARLLLRVFEIERDHMAILHEAGCDTIETWLKSEKLVDPARYSRFRRGLELVGEAEALAIGAEATIEAARLQGPPEPYLAAVHDWSADHGGVMPSREKARHLLHQVDPRPEVPQSSKRQSELSKLRAENSELRAELRATKRKLAKLEKQLAKEQKAA